MKERWKTIIGYNNYKISNTGKVYSKNKGDLLILRYNNKGYAYVDLHINNKPKRFCVHHLVAEYFIGLRPEGYVCNHKDGTKSNNYVSNLEWVTPRENYTHGIAMGLLNYKGEGPINSGKLKNNDVLFIRWLYSTGDYNYEDISKLFPVSSSQISRIVRYIDWNHI